MDLTIFSYCSSLHFFLLKGHVLTYISEYIFNYSWIFYEETPVTFMIDQCYPPVYELFTYCFIFFSFMAAYTGCDYLKPSFWVIFCFKRLPILFLMMLWPSICLLGSAVFSFLLLVYFLTFYWNCILQLFLTMKQLYFLLRYARFPSFIHWL